MISLTHDVEHDVWTLHYGTTRLASASDVIAWRAAVWTELEKLGERRADLLIDMTEFSMEPAVAALYAPIAKGISDQHARAIVRFGKPDAKTTQALQIAATKIGYPIKVEPDFDSAMKAIEHIRSTRSRGSRPSIPDR